jgi:phosphoglycerol geranylgeranyltransferase
MTGPVEKQLRRDITKLGTLCFGLIDSQGLTPSSAARTAETCQQCGVSAILVGGSTAIDQLEVHSIVKSIKKSVTIPVILFCGNVTGISPDADAILFSSLLNSDNPYFITQAQALGALAIRKYQLEAIPLAYLVIGDGGSVGFVGRTRGIPPKKPALASMYALAAQYMGMRSVYLEGGSGVTSHVPADLVSLVRSLYDGTIFVGGGIRTLTQATTLAKAGADILVIGSLLEEEGFDSTLKQIVRKVQPPKGRSRTG